MGATADRLLRLIVLKHEPTDNYEIDDLLRNLNDTPAPKKLTAVEMRNSASGWTGSRKLAKV